MLRAIAGVLFVGGAAAAVLMDRAEEGEATAASIHVDTVEYVETPALHQPMLAQDEGTRAPHATRATRAAPHEKAAPPPAGTAQGATWKSDPGSPLALLPLEAAERYLPTPENLQIWIDGIDELSDVGTPEWTPELRDAWGICCEHFALRTFVLTYEDREAERAAAGKPSVSLEAELRDISVFEAQHVGDMGNALNDYSLGVKGGRDALLLALIEAGKPAFLAVAEILREGTN